MYSQHILNLNKTFLLTSENFKTGQKSPVKSKIHPIILNIFWENMPKISKTISSASQKTTRILQDHDKSESQSQNINDKVERIM